MSLDTKQKMCQAWKSWLIYMVSRRTKLHMKTTALEFRSQSVLWWVCGELQVSKCHFTSALVWYFNSLILEHSWYLLIAIDNIQLCLLYTSDAADD